MGDHKYCRAAKITFTLVELLAHLCVFYLFLSHVLGVHGQVDDALLLAYDCTDPKHLLGVEYDEPRCREERVVKVMYPARYQVLRRIPASYLKGWSCQAELATDQDCFPGTPSPAEIPLSILPEHCQTLWKFRVYQDPTGTTHPLQARGITLSFPRPNYDNQSCCDFSKTLTLDQLVNEQMGCLRSMKLTLLDEAFLPHLRGLEIFSNRQRLPCQPRQKSCELGNITYGWEKGNQDCPLRLVVLPLDQGGPDLSLDNTTNQSITGLTDHPSQGVMVVGTNGQQAYFSNDGLQLRLLLLGQTSACGRALITTNDPDLFLRNADGATAFLWDIAMPDISVSLISPSTSDFYLKPFPNGRYGAGVVEREYRHVMNHHCRNAGSGFVLNPWLRRNDPGVRTWSLGPGFYASGQGDMVCQYRCPQRYVQVQEDFPMLSRLTSSRSGGSSPSQLVLPRRQREIQEVRTILLLGTRDPPPSRRRV